MYLKKQQSIILSLLLLLSSTITILGQEKSKKDDSKINNITQGVLRKQNKLQVAISPLSQSINLQYNINSKVSINTSFSVIGRYEAENEFVYSTSISNLALEYKKFDYRGLITKFDLKLFPIDEFPIYITTGISKDFYGKSYTYEMWGFLNVNNLEFTFSPNTYTQDLKPEFFYDIGIGFQWIFKNNIFLSIEAYKYYFVNRKINEHSYAYVRGFTDASFYEPDYINGIILRNYTEYINRNYHVNLNSISPLPKYMIWFGYSFKL